MFSLLQSPVSPFAMSGWGFSSSLVKGLGIEVEGSGKLHEGDEDELSFSLSAAWEMGTETIW
ncbi:MAG: hypothetical protein WD273_03420 [Trueperaceae bacterium]